jgi:hypothetical protein
MKHLLQHADDIRWLIAHTKGFRGGYITDLRMSKNRLFDEESGRDVPISTMVTVVLRYRTDSMLRTARLIMTGVSDFSLLEQEGEDVSTIEAFQTEISDERLRFWFDPEGRLYVVCEQAVFEEVASPAGRSDIAPALTRWTFQADEGDLPSVEWLLNHLDRAGMPCVWRAAPPRIGRHPSIRWEGQLMSSSRKPGGRRTSVHITAHSIAEYPGFGMALNAQECGDPDSGRILTLVADLVARTFPGTCVAGDIILSCEEWLCEKQREESRHMG